MKLIATIYRYNSKVHSQVILFSSFCLTLLLLRAKITNSIYLFFLIWNLILATIPYLITSYLSIQKNINNKPFVKYIVILIWLLFLPNSFYIITDLVHIVNSSKSLFWFDLILISSFAIIGFTLGIMSMLQFENIIKIKKAFIFIPILAFLNGVGIYIGRILRYNSWDLISNPINLIEAILEQVFTLESFSFSSLLGAFIYFVYQLTKQLNQKI